MTENKGRKTAIRARMAETGAPYIEAAGWLDEQTATSDTTSTDTTASAFETALRQFGIPRDVLTLAGRHCAETDRYPLLGARTADRLKISLDVKDWVALAKARLGRPQFPQDARAYEALRAATAAGEVIVPLTAATYMEVARISSLRWRTDLANVIAEVSGFVAITGLSFVVEHQLRIALAALFGGPPPAPIPVFGLGNPFGVGEQKAFVLRRKGGGAPDLPAALVREIETASRVMGEYLLLRGPAPEDMPALRALGYRPEEVAKVEEARVNREKELATMLKDGTANRGRLGDIVHARYLYWELGDRLPAALQPYSIDVSDFFAKGKEWMTVLLDDIPSAAINITLADKGFRNSYKKWTGNDIRDADAVSAAIPYCDVVMTDNYVAAQLAKAPAVARHGTLVLSRLSDLNDALPDLIASRAT
jgi:hypothetical protein